MSPMMVSAAFSCGNDGCKRNPFNSELLKYDVFSSSENADMGKIGLTEGDSSIMFLQERAHLFSSREIDDT